MSVSLNEFTKEQLALYIQVFNEKIDDVNYHIQTLEKLPFGDVQFDLMITYQKEFDDALLMRVQLQNALEEVTSKEKELSN